MSDINQIVSQESLPSESKTPAGPDVHRRRGLAIRALILLAVFVAGGGGGYLLGSQIGHGAMESTAGARDQELMRTLMQQVNPPDGYQIQAVYGDVGPQMLAAGAIDLDKFTKLYQQQNKPLTNDQMSILSKGSNSKVVINPENAYFLLNFFWALGLVNQNDILTEGPMVSRGRDQVGGFASTGGWTIGLKSPIDLYASTKIITLTDEQQTRLQEVASRVYRPCCDNPTQFPDCNHGMAMLGLLELMASQNATTDDMLTAAKYVTAFWYPQQMLEIAIAFKAGKNVDFIQADASSVISPQFASLSGFQSVHQWLSQNSLLEQAPNSGGSCGVQ